MTMTRVTRHGSQDGNSRITQTHTVISSNLSLKGLTSPTNRRQSAASETQAPGEVAACPAGSEKTSCRRRRLGRENPPRHGGTPRPESETDHGGDDCCKLQNMAPCVARSSLFSPFRWLSGVGQREGAFGNLLFFH
jgi:hypothetical protein